jgi:DNA (cytosine-5)-methyltransferase 1
MQDELFNTGTMSQTGSWFSSVLQVLGVKAGAAWPDHFGSALRSWLYANGHQPIRTLSLFSGGGGLDIAFHDAGFHSLEMLELESKFVSTLQCNTQEGGYLEGSIAVRGDIREYIPAENFQVDFLIGGPPCQTFSAAGRRASGVSGTTDSRGNLFLEYVRLLKCLRPRGFLFENVYGITGAQGGEDWLAIQQAFRDAGYVIHWRVLDAADYGVPQHRERLFIVGVRDGEIPYRFPAPTHGPDAQNMPYYTAAEAVFDADTSNVSFGIKGRYGTLLEDVPPGLNYSFFTKEMGHPFPVFSWRSKFSDFLYKADPDAPIRTLKAQGGQYTGPFHWENRKFSLAELKRLQTFPDAYRLEGSDLVATQQLGNSVPPQLGRVLAVSILEELFGAKLPFQISYLKPHEELGFRTRKRSLTAKYAAKATAALREMHANGRLHPIPTTDFRVGIEQRMLGNNFSWNTQGSGIEIHLEFSVSDDAWRISAGLQAYGTPMLIIQLEPHSSHPWVLDVNTVLLEITDDSDASFTAVWKAFEERLLEVTGKADLVQLNGYYQYEPRIRANVSNTSKVPKWHLLTRVLSGDGVGLQLDIQQFAILWGAEAINIMNFMRWLRQLGFEVRNHYTNPQIPSGEFLIPYAFPTLTPRSVQLRKSLEVGHAD